MTWDINVKYDGSTIYYYFGDYLINSQRVDLLSAFNGWAYLGWSGFIRADRELEIRDMYVCEDVHYKEVRAYLSRHSNRNNYQESITHFPNETVHVKLLFYSRTDQVAHNIGQLSDYFNVDLIANCGTLDAISLPDNFTVTLEVKEIITTNLD